MSLLFLFLSSLIMGNFITDSYKTDNGKNLEIGFIAHGSLVFNYDGTIIYVDPAEATEKFENAPKADIICYTHGHSDHFDPVVFDKIYKAGTKVICNEEVGKELESVADISIEVLNNGDKNVLNDGDIVTAVPAHNHPNNHRFHPPHKNNGYLFNFDGLTIYVAGDTEDIEEMKDLQKEEIDITFLPVNQPYTMTFEQAVNAVSMITPKIFYPYHFGPTHTQEEMKDLEQMLKGQDVIVKIRPLE